MIRISNLMILAVLLSAGCSGGPRMAEVSGVVKRDGKPLEKVRVEFWPETDGPKSSGVTDDQGRYVLKTEDGLTTGAMVGSHKVILKDLNAYGDQFLGRKAENMPVLNKDAKRRFATIYENATNTPFKVNVEAGKPNTIDLDVR